MKKILLAFICLLVMSLLACDFNEEIVGETEELNYQVNQNEMAGLLDDLSPHLHLIRNIDWCLTEEEVLNEIILIDLLTGEPLARYNFGERTNVLNYWDLGNGYYFVGVMYWGTGGIYDVVNKIIIFNEDLEVINVMPYNQTLIESIYFSFLSYVDGEFFIYSLEPSGINNHTPRQVRNPVRFNLHSGELERLAEINEPLWAVRRLINDNQIFVTERIILFDEGRMITRYGILDLETETVKLFEKENFGYGRLDFFDNYVLIAEGESVGPPLRNEVVIFDFENMSSQIIELSYMESVWARFSYNGDYIVTVNEEESVFRKYNFDGEVIAEIEFESPDNLVHYDVASDHLLYARNTTYRFDIIAINDSVYVLQTTVIRQTLMGVLLDNHFQVIVLP